MMMIKAMKDIEEGVKVGGQLVKDVKFADDQGMISSSERGLQRLIDGLTTTAKKYDLKINVKRYSEHCSRGADSRASEEIPVPWSNNNRDVIGDVKQR